MGIWKATKYPGVRYREQKKPRHRGTAFQALDKPHHWPEDFQRN